MILNFFFILNKKNYYIYINLRWNGTKKGVVESVQSVTPSITSIMEVCNTSGTVANENLILSNGGEYGSHTMIKFLYVIGQSQNIDY